MQNSDELYERLKDSPFQGTRASGLDYGKKAGYGAKMEVDSHSGEGRQRERIGQGSLPGMAMVSFQCPSFAKHTKHFLQPPTANALEPCNGKRVGKMPGAGGEVIELIEA